VSLADDLNTLLADTVTMAFQAQGYHWNVEGQDFLQYHGLFQDVYEDLFSAIDPIAENVRKLDEYALFQLQDYTKSRTVTPGAAKPNTRAMVKELTKVNDGLLKTLEKCFSSAEKDKNQAIMDFIAGRMDMHAKWRWFLRSSNADSK
jgi:starvation-inducible DNA-binding protein